MNRIVKKEYLNPEVVRIEVEAPQIAVKRKAGQFVILRATSRGERVPLTIVDSDARAGTITLIYQVVGRSTRELAMLDRDRSILDLLGPLGQPTHVDKVGTVVAVGGGVGIALLYPIVKAMHDAGNKVVSIIGARNKELLILKDEIEKISTRMEIVSDDGSTGRKALVTEPLIEYIESGEPIDQLIAVGPAIMMKACADIARPREIPTIVSLNPIMVDGTGMCGGCRVTVGGETKFACVDGPEFDGLTVDFDELMHRQRFYTQEEQESSHFCRLDEH